MSDKDNQNFVERFTIRMPDGMRDAVAERAKANGRSMNSEIIQILQDALDTPLLSVADNLTEEKALNLTKHLELMMKILTDGGFDGAPRERQDWYSKNKDTGRKKPK